MENPYVLLSRSPVGPDGWQEFSTEGEMLVEALYQYDRFNRISAAYISEGAPVVLRLLWVIISKGERRKAAPR